MGGSDTRGSAETCDSGASDTGCNVVGDSWFAAVLFTDADCRYCNKSCVGSAEIVDEATVFADVCLDEDAESIFQWGRLNGTHTICWPAAWVSRASNVACESTIGPAGFSVGSIQTTGLACTFEDVSTVTDVFTLGSDIKQTRGWFSMAPRTRLKRHRGW